MKGRPSKGCRIQFTQRRRLYCREPRVLEKWDTIKERFGCLATDGSTNIFHQLNADSLRSNAGSEARSAI